MRDRSLFCHARWHERIESVFLGLLEQRCGPGQYFVHNGVWYALQLSGVAR